MESRLERFPIWNPNPFGFPDPVPRWGRAFLVPTPGNSETSAGYPRIQLKTNIAHLEIASDTIGEVSALQDDPHPTLDAICKLWRLEVPMTFSLGSFNLLEQLPELRVVLTYIYLPIY